MKMSDLIEQMAEAGAPLEAIILAVRAVEGAGAEVEQRRAGDRERKRRQRDKSRDGHGTVTGQSRDKPPVSFPETKTVSPTPPSEKTQTHTLAPHPPIVPPPRADFDVFWEAWTPKVSRGQAEITFAKLMKSRIVDLPTLVAAAERAKTTRRWLDGKAPHASTWLNAKGWLDEPDSPPPKLEVIHGRSAPDARQSAREANYERAFRAPSLMPRHGGAG